MPVPEDYIVEPLRQATQAIANLQDRDHFEEYDFQLFPASERDLSDGAYPVVLTNIHMMPGEEGPSRLHKIRFQNADIRADKGQELEQRFVEDIKGKGASLSNDRVRVLAQQILEACTAIEEPASIIVPFQTLAVFGVYNTEHNRPFAYSFIAKPLVDALVERLPDPTPIPEEVLRDMHANEAEQVVGTEPFPEWRELVQESILTYNPKDPAQKRDLAKATMAWTFLPRADTHPVINAVLFPLPEEPESEGT